jgi:hypothetical protein
VRSYLKIDGVRLSLDAQGNYKSKKLPHVAHSLELELFNNSGDSTYIATYSLPAADQVFNPGVNSNVGTGKSLASLRRFCYVVDFQVRWTPALEGVLKSIDFKHAKDYTFWITRKDTAGFGEYTTQEQDEIEAWIRNDIFKYLPDSLQPNIYKAALNEGMPVETGTLVPAKNIMLIMKRKLGQPGAIGVYNDNLDGILNGANISFTTPLSKSAVLQEALTALVAPSDLQDNANEYAGLSCLVCMSGRLQII